MGPVRDFFFFTTKYSFWDEEVFSVDNERLVLVRRMGASVGVCMVAAKRKTRRGRRRSQQKMSLKEALPSF